MYLPFCSGKRWGKGHREAKAASKSPISWTPSPHGQVECSRLIAGDASAASDLSTLITRAGATSARLPYLNSNGVVATSNLLLGHTEDGVSRLAEEQAAAERRSRTTRPWSLFFSNASLIGENFQQGLMGFYGQSSRDSVRANDSAPSVNTCRGHWQWRLVCCDFEDCSVYHTPSEHPPSRPVTAEDVEKLPDQHIRMPSPTLQGVSLTPSLEEELDAQEAEEEGEELPFDADLRDENEYEQALYAITVAATRPGSPKLVTLNRKHEVADAEVVSAALEVKGEEAADEQRWSTQAQTGCSDACTEAPRKERAPQSSRLSLAGPPSDPPSIPLPPNPPSSVSSSPMQFSE